MICRPNLEPFYRSDVAWLDRLHGEAAVDLPPEELADRAGGRFRSGPDYRCGGVAGRASWRSTYWRIPPWR